MYLVGVRSSGFQSRSGNRSQMIKNLGVDSEEGKTVHVGASFKILANEAKERHRMVI